MKLSKDTADFVMRLVGLVALVFVLAGLGTLLSGNPFWAVLLDTLKFFGVITALGLGLIIVASSFAAHPPRGL